MSNYRIKKVSPNDEMPQYYAQYLDGKTWTTIYDGETFLLFDSDTKSIDCRFRTSEQAECCCQEHKDFMNPSDVTYAELDI